MILLGLVIIMLILATIVARQENQRHRLLIAYLRSRSK